MTLRFKCKSCGIDKRLNDDPGKFKPGPFKCPKCKERGKIYRVKESASPSKPSKDIVVSPAMFRNRPIWFSFLAFCAFMFFISAPDMSSSIGFQIPFIIIFGIWWLKCKHTSLTITTDKSVFRRGLLSKSTSEIRHSDVRNLQLSQRMMQRIFNVGNISISSAGQSDVEILVHGIPKPNDIIREINARRES